MRIALRARRPETPGRPSPRTISDIVGDEATPSRESILYDGCFDRPPESDPRPGWSKAGDPRERNMSVRVRIVSANLPPDNLVHTQRQARSAGTPEFVCMSSLTPPRQASERVSERASKRKGQLCPEITGLAPGTGST
jgi:hypothetical protein